MITCTYCKHYTNARVLAKIGNELLQKECLENPSYNDPLFDEDEQGITCDTEACEYMDPAENFFCDELHQRQSPVLCLHRRINQKGMEAYQKCANCRQFEQEVGPYLTKYFFNLEQPVKPLKLKRRRKREQPDSEPTSEPTLKRRGRRKPRKPEGLKLKRRRR